jgi:hypothetical protein
MESMQKKSLLFQFLSILIILPIAFGFSQPTQAQTPPKKAVEYPQVCTIGTHISSLYEFNLADRSFGTDFMLWSNCSVANVEPFKSINFLNAKNLEISVNIEQKRGNSYWSLIKVRGTFRFPWRVENYPFDRHVLTIPFEDKIRDVTLLFFKSDIEKPSINPNLTLSGWELGDLKLDIDNFAYNTTFGDPELVGTGRSVYSRMNISIPISRNRIVSFFKLTTPAYIALGIAGISFLMSSAEPPLMSGRMGIIVGSLFSVVLNMRSSESVLGRIEGLTLVDKIHINTMIYILIAAIAAIVSRTASKFKGEKHGKYVDRIGLPIFAISYILINFILVESAKSIG